MKRFPRTLTAAVMAGALAVGGATVAQAQEEIPNTITVDGVEYHKQDDGYYKADPNALGTDGEGLGLPDELSPDQAKKIWEDSKAADEGGSEEGGSEEGGSEIPDTITIEGVEYHKQPDGSYKADPNAIGNKETDWDLPNELTAEQAKRLWEEEQAKQQPGDTDGQNPGDNQGSSDFDKKKLAWLALPAALIIGGIVYHLMKDGQTYTPDEGRKNEDPTAEEKAASDKLLGENKDEVIAQGGQLAEGADAAATDRGIAAETGSNAAARGLASLAVVAMVAAGAFAASRKLFA
ncbi:hypothetical protein [Corynebacterium urealyticum]|uniref:hypothetical protein n=1 Tax=Corynebacterium urealyticum TaxID=43771 RepID=UPI00293ED230|nr:hypothetical protein [Corynebacterium urealyticum]WOH94697.1 hypothetical protein RZ943_01460 [Corynebacterium urealyticum]